MTMRPDVAESFLQNIHLVYFWFMCGMRSPFLILHRAWDCHFPKKILIIINYIEAYGNQFFSFSAFIVFTCSSCRKSESGQREGRGIQTERRRKLLHRARMLCMSLGLVLTLWRAASTPKHRHNRKKSHSNRPEIKAGGLVII